MALSGQQYDRYRAERQEYMAEQRHSLEEEVERSPDTRREIRSQFAALEVPGTPNVRQARILQIMGVPDWCGTREVQDVRVQHGKPLSGEARSEDHISRFEVSLPFGEIEWQDVRGKNPDMIPDHGYVDVCHECGCDRARYTYSATHHICGYTLVECDECDAVYAREDWS